MRDGIRPAARLANGTFLILLALALGCKESPMSGKRGPAQPLETTMFSESEAYERFMGRWSERLAPLFLKFAGLKDGERVLDVGSGTGSLAFAVRKEAPAG